MSRWLHLAWFSLILAAATAGCGGDDSEDFDKGDPEEASRAFVTAVADADPAACSYLNADGIEVVELVGQGSCEEVMERGVLVSRLFQSSDPEDLRTGLEGETELHEGPFHTEFRFSLPNDCAKGHLELVEAGGSWEISAIRWSQVDIVFEGRKIRNQDVYAKSCSP